MPLLYVCYLVVTLRTCYGALQIVVLLLLLLLLFIIIIITMPKLVVLGQMV